MAKFVTSNDLNASIERIFESASEQLILISPFVKLHHRYQSALRTKISIPKLHIIVVFGKNETDPSRSIDANDLELFKQLPNIEVRYEKRLHAKYYANESAAVLTSMNLFHHSQDYNIECGVLIKTSLAGSIGNLVGAENLDQEAWNHFHKVIDQSELIFKRVPQFENKLMGLTKKYTTSTVEVDKIESFFLKEKKLISERAKFGYCILTGTKIEFNIEKPLSYSAYKTWAISRDANYAGEYCHFTGEQGRTTFNRPVLRKNWAKMQEVMGM